MSNSSPLGFLVVDNRTDDILYFNQRFCQIWGIEHLADRMHLGELKNNDIIPDCIPVLADVAAFAESCKPLQDEANRIVLEDEIAFTEGRTIRRFSTQIRGELDEYYGRFYIFENISDRKRDEDLIAQTRQNYEGFFNTIDEFLFVLDVQGNIIHANTTITDRLGYAMDELLGQSVLLVHPPERRNEAGRIVGEMLSGTTEFCPVPVVTKTGVQIPVETRVSHGNWNGQPAIFGVTKDISKVRLSEEKFSKLFYINPSACGLSGLDDGKYIEVNEAFYALLGFDKNEVIGRTASELGILNEETIKAILRNADSNGNVTNAEADLRAKSGEIKHVLLSSENIYVQEKKYRYTVVNDITERKRNEAEIKLKNDELLKLNTEKDKFFSIIAHDLRNPFNSFLGLTQLMTEGLPDLKMDEIQSIALSLRKSATSLYRLLENLLNWARMQQGLIPFNQEEVQLLPVVEESISMVQEPARIKCIEMTYDISENLEVFADGNMLQTVIRNLLLNAVKFTPRGGKVRLSARIPDDKIAEISVADSGIGMSHSMVDNLFRLDMQTNRRGTEGEPSTGLGLILCKDSIEKHGGRIWAESEEGKGSTFIFTVPLNIKHKP